MKSWSFTVPGVGMSGWKMTLTTNLDLHQAEKMPAILPCIPRAGDRITSSCSHYDSPSYRLTLEVVRVEFEENRVLVELHLPKTFSSMPLKEWYERIYQPVTGGRYV